MIDWFRVVADLQRCGMSIRTVGGRSGVGYWRVYDAWRGRRQDLRHAEGERLLDVWSAATHRDKSDAPTLS